MNKHPLVSIIVAVYNTKDYLKQCIDSLLNQTYSNLQIILIDDGSNDGSDLILKNFVTSDSRVEYYYQENSGVSTARNNGLDKVKGEYIAFLDSDDYYLSDYIQTLYNIILDNNCDISCCDENINNESKHYCDDIKIFTPHELLVPYLEEDMYFYENLNMKLYKTSIWNGLRCPEGRIHEDTYLCYQLIERAKRIGYIHYNGYIRNRRSDSITNKSYSNKNYDVCDANKQSYLHFKGSEFEILAANKYLGSLLYFIIKTNGLKEVSLNSQAYLDLKVLLKDIKFLNIKNRLKPFVFLYKLNLLKLIKI